MSESLTANTPAGPFTSYQGWGEWSAQAELLQYSRGGAIYNATNFNFGMAYGYPAYVNLTASTRAIATFGCPSDTNWAFGGAPSMSQATLTNWGNSTVSAEHQQLPRQHRYHNRGVQYGRILRLPA